MKLKLRKRKGKNRTIFSILFMALIFMGIGYAYIQSQLTIGGNVTAKKQKWNIEMKNITVDSDSTANIDSIKKIDKKLEVHFQANLTSIDDYYSFYFDIENKSSQDAKLSKIELLGLSTQEQSFVDYSLMYYSNSEQLNINDKLPAGEMETICVTVKYKESSTTTSGKYNLSFKLEYTALSGDSNERGSTLYLTMKNNSVPDNIASTNVSAATGINYKEVSSETNGQGIYLKTTTEQDTYPVYFYRGNINNNYVNFAKYCWQILRTTETGGVKLIYNGALNADGSCTEHNSADNIIGTGGYSYKTTSLSDAGYMLGARYEVTNDTSVANLEGPIIYAETVNYDETTKKYTLQNTFESTDYQTDLSQIQMHHYTCLNSDTQCEQVYYFNYNTDTKMTYVLLSNGKKISNLLDEMFPESNERNKTNNKMKDAIDEWYANNLIDYTEKLEDTYYSNCKNPYYSGGWDEKNSSKGHFIYDTTNNSDPTLYKCESKYDNFTVSENNGNGKLTYPVGTINLGEAVMAGGKYASAANTMYLSSKNQYWLMSVNSFASPNADAYFIGENLASDWVWRGSTGYRPVISLKRGTKYTSGSGLVNEPYVIR